MENVKSGQTTLYRAAKLYKITKATIFEHDKELRGVKATRCVDQMLSSSMKRKKKCRVSWVDGEMGLRPVQKRSSGDDRPVCQWKQNAQRVIYPIIISEQVITTGAVRERVKETVSKTCERQEQARKKKTAKKKEESGDSERLKPQAAI